MGTYAGGYLESEVFDKIRLELGEMLARNEETPEWYSRLITKTTTNGTYDRYMGYKRLDILQKWDDGDPIAQTTNSVWKKDYYPKRFGIATTIDLHDKEALSGRLGSVNENAVKNLANGIPVFEKQAFADQLSATTTLLDDALDLVAYDGLNLFNSTAGRFGLSTGNIITPDADGTESADFKSQVFQWCQEFENMTDDLGYPFHDEDEINPENLLIVASNARKEAWSDMIRSSFFPKNAAVGSTANVFGENKVAPPMVKHNRRLTGDDYYVFYVTEKFKPLRWTYYEYTQEGQFDVLGPDRENPVTGKIGGGSSYQFTRTDAHDSHTVLYGEGYYALYCKLVAGVEKPQNAIKCDIT